MLPALQQEFRRRSPRWIGPNHSTLSALLAEKWQALPGAVTVLLLTTLTAKPADPASNRPLAALYRVIDRAAYCEREATVSSITIEFKFTYPNS
jgi:hypothetical protein